MSAADLDAADFVTCAGARPGRRRAAALMAPMAERAAPHGVPGVRHPAGRIGLVMALILLGACGFGTAPDAERLALDPLTLERTGKPNDFLVCPAGRCMAPSDRVAPVLDVAPLEQLHLWEEVVEMSDRTRIIGLDETALTLHAEQRSRIFGFVDTIVVRVLPFDDGRPGAARSTFAAYSRAELGFGDMGVNQARLEGWIANLEAVAGAS